MPDSRARILVFARVPRAGRVKTRLIPALGAQGACELHVKLVERTLALTARVDAPVELWLDGEAGNAAVARWRSRYRVEVRAQRGSNLGLRMQSAIDDTLRTARSAVVLGSDCVTLTARDVREALQRLHSQDAVIAPARDGGYVLLGVSRTAGAILQRIPWGTRHVLAATRRRMDALGWRYAMLRWQHDVDRPADLARAARALGEVEVPRRI